jgi:hypothetical protein
MTTTEDTTKHGFWGELWKNVDPWDENHHALYGGMMLFVVLILAASWISGRAFHQSDEELAKEMARYAEEGRLYAEAEWDKFENNAQRKKKTS